MLKDAGGLSYLSRSWLMQQIWALRRVTHVLDPLVLAEQPCPTNRLCSRTAWFYFALLVVFSSRISYPSLLHLLVPYPDHLDPCKKPIRGESPCISSQQLTKFKKLKHASWCIHSMQIFRFCPIIIEAYRPLMQITLTNSAGLGVSQAYTTGNSYKLAFRWVAQEENKICLLVLNNQT